MTTSDLGEGRIRGVWPDQSVATVNRARAVAKAYREEAKRQKARADALQEAIATMDLRVLEFADAGLAAKVRSLLDQASGDPVRVLDAQFLDWGEDWHFDADDPPTLEPYLDSDYVPSTIAHKIAGISDNHFGQMRIHGLLNDYQHVGRAGYVYRVREARTAKDRLPGKHNGVKGRAMFPRPRAPRKK